MALFMIERNFAAALNVSAEDLTPVVDINTAVGVKWLHSFLSADKRKTYSLYEAESGDAIRRAAQHARLPPDILRELDALGAGLAGRGDRRSRPPAPGRPAGGHAALRLPVGRGAP